MSETDVRGRLLRCATLALTVLAFAAIGNASPSLPHIFSDRMVLQRDAPIVVWGWADPGETIVVTLAGESASTAADSHRGWRLELPALHAGGPFALTVAGNTTITLTNVLIGEVWLASGQSNMVFALSNAAGGAEEAARADLPDVRFFTVPKTIAMEPKADTRPAEWQICTPETAKSFSAVAYFFAAELQRKLNVPVGIILSAWSGSAAEEWTPPQSMRGKPILDSIYSEWEAEPADVKSFAVKPASFQIDFDGFELIPAGAEPAKPLSFSDFSDGFARTSDGGRWSYDWPGGAGTWFELSRPGHDGRGFSVRTAGELDGRNSSNLNVSLALDDAPKDLSAYSGVRFWARGDGAFRFQSLQPTIYDWDNYRSPIITVTTEWKPYTVQFKDLKQDGWGVVEPFTINAVSGFRLISLSKAGEPDRPPSGMYEGMITPLAPIRIRGAIWYQGESNGTRGFQYRTLLPSLITGWRVLWNQGDFPFLVVQLPNHGSSPEFGDSNWAELREAQLQTAETVPHVGLVVTVDVGDARNVHPARKREVGARAALWAFGYVYDEKVPYSSPLFDSFRVAGNTVVVKFKPTGSPLMIHDGTVLKGFTIAGSDKQFYAADARIDGDTVVVSSAAVAAPVSVRYDWMDDPSGNLFNAAGLPASPFRTDDWPGLSLRK